MIEVELITHNSNWIPQLADGFAAEWPQWATTIPRGELESGFLCGENGNLPLVLIAHEEGQALGTVALRHWFAEEPMAESPWVRGLYVMPGHRGRGVDRMLLRAVEREALDRGFKVLYAATTRIERLALRRGWRVFRRLEHEDESMAWMSLTLTPTLYQGRGSSRSGKRKG
ncbi:MAG: GNAT family N-acetyltransferase [Usitatibacter sp.]